MNNKDQIQKLIGRFDLVDDRMKLSNSVWASCTRKANQIGMTEDERMKFIAANVVTQNMILLNAVATLSQRCDDNRAIIHELFGKVPVLSMDEALMNLVNMAMAEQTEVVTELSQIKREEPEETQPE